MSSSRCSFLFVLAFLLSTPASALNGTCATPLLGASTSGLLEAVAGVQNTIGYAGLDSIDAKKALEKTGEACTMKIASMVNKFGSVVKPSSDGAQAAVRSNADAFMASSCPGFGLCAEIYDGGDSDVWPISTLTYMIVPTNTTDEMEGCDKMKTLYEYVRWILEDSVASEIAKELSMATMPVIIAQQAVQILDEMQCFDSEHGWHFVKDRTTRAAELEGSGSSLQGGLQTRLTNQYFQENFVSISYTPSSSGRGRDALRKREYDFSGSDSILDMEDPEFIKRGMKMIPAFAAAVGVVFNVAEMEELVLDRPSMEKVFTGEIFGWNDPSIVATNPDTASLLPPEAIIRTVRESKSGTTSALTKALYAFAGHPTGSGHADYDLHILGGSGLPDWPEHPQPYPDGVTCKYKHCIRAVCEPGNFLNVETEACEACPEGTFSNTRGQHASCSRCPAGSYTNTVGNSKCVSCDDQKYQQLEGQRQCTPCPANSRRFSVEAVGEDGVAVTRESAGVSKDECKCEAGYWLPQSIGNATMGGEACVQCPEGATCLGFPYNVPQTKRGFWGNPAHPQTMFECQEDACLKDYECVDGHGGRLCADPTDGYFTIGELWFFECPAQEWRTLFTLFFVCMVILVWMLLHHFSLKYDAFDVAFLFFQIIGIISKFRLRWHPNLSLVLIALRIINFDVDFFGPQCMLPEWSAPTAYFVQVFLPAIVVACYTGYFKVLWWFKSRSTKPQAKVTADTERLNKGYIRSTDYDSDDLLTYLWVKGVSYLMMMYHTLAFRAFSVFACEQDSDGERFFMVASPTQQCWTSTHIAMAVCSVLYIPTVIFGLPLYILWTMRRLQRESKLQDFDMTVKYWFFFAQYKEAFPWWDLVLTSRRLALVLLLVFVPVSMLQAALAIAFLNAYLFLHLTRTPFKDDRVNLLESFGLCCSMAYAACGMLFYPSLDYTNECVGSSNLEELGDKCGNNIQVKRDTSILLLLLLFTTVMAALYISFKDIQEKVFSAAAAKKIEADKKWYGKDKLLKAVQEQAKNGSTDKRIERVSSIHRAQSLDSDRAAVSLETMMVNSAKNLTKCDQKGAPTWKLRKAVDAIMKLRQRDEGTEFAKPEKLNLCDMLVGDYLQNWHRSLVTLSEKELGVRLMFSDDAHQYESQSMRQEMAYMDLEEWIPVFAVRHEGVNGHWSTNELARVLDVINSELPELMNWLTAVEHETVQRFSNFINSYTIFANRSKKSALHKLIVPLYKGSVAHWLMQCSDEEQRAFLTLFGGMNSTAVADMHEGFISKISRTVTIGSPVASPSVQSPSGVSVFASNRVADESPMLPPSSSPTFNGDSSGTRTALLAASTLASS